MNDQVGHFSDGETPVWYIDIYSNLIFQAIEVLSVAVQIYLVGVGSGKWVGEEGVREDFFFLFQNIHYTSW